MDTKIIKKATDIVSQKDKIAIFGLVDSGGFPFVSAVVSIKNSGMNEFWISTSPQSRKAQIIKENNKAGLCYNDSDNNISMMGIAEIVNDQGKKKELWIGWMKNFFTGGPEDEDYILIKFTTQKARLCVNGQTKDYTIDEINGVIG